MTLFAWLSGAASLGVASCAEAGGDVDVRPEADAPLDVPADASTPDGGCDADSDCAPTEIDCSDVDFCPENTPLDPRHALRAIWGTAANDVWAVGSAGTILHFDGTRWVRTPVDTDRLLSAVGGSGKNDVWVAGTTKAIFHASGLIDGQAAWTNVAPYMSVNPGLSLPAESLVFAALSRTADDMWFGGQCRFDANEGTAFTQWRARATHADAGSTGEAVTWAVAGPCPSVDPFNPWGTYNYALYDAVRAMWKSGSSLWAAANVGKIYHAPLASEDDGDPVWTELDSQALVDLYGGWGSEDNDVWIVGGGGTIRHYTGKSILDFVPSPTDSDLNAVWGASSDDIWAVGKSGTILHYDGAEWRPAAAIFPYGMPHLYGIWGSGPEDVWAVGEGVLLRLVKPKHQGDGQ